MLLISQYWQKVQGMQDCNEQIICLDRVHKAYILHIYTYSIYSEYIVLDFKQYGSIDSVLPYTLE